MKQILYIASFALLAISSSAKLMSGFEFNDVSGTVLTNATQSAPGAGQWNQDNGNTATDGKGKMFFTKDQALISTSTLAFTLSSGSIRLSTTISSANIPSNDGEFTFQLLDDSDVLGLIQLRYNDAQDGNDSMMVVFHSGWNGGTAHLEPVGQHYLTAPLTAWADIDLDQNQVSYFYEYKGVTNTENTVTIPANVAPDLLKASYQYMETDAASIAVDYVRVETIPEPVSIALIGIFGGSLLLIYRRMRMT